jgi:hypothetical protein
VASYLQESWPRGDAAAGDRLRTGKAWSSPPTRAGGRRPDSAGKRESVSGPHSPSRPASRASPGGINESSPVLVKGRRPRRNGLEPVEGRATHRAKGRGRPGTASPRRPGRRARDASGPSQTLHGSQSCCSSTPLPHAAGPCGSLGNIQELKSVKMAWGVHESDLTLDLATSNLPKTTRLLERRRSTDQLDQELQ